MSLRLNNLTIDTRVRLTNDQGKYRFRVVPTNQYPQVQNQLAAALLLPKPIRDETKTEGGQPVVLENSYVIKNINLDNVAIIGADAFIADVISIDCQNQTVMAEQILASMRMTDIQRIWQERAKLPRDIAILVAQHEKIVRSGNPIPRSCQKLVVDLQKQIAQHSEFTNIPYTRGTYVVPSLLSMINDVIEDVPLSIEQIEPSNIELKKREITKWQIYANRRGGASIQFRKDVQAAYDYRCVMCGCRYPPTNYNRNPGIDAAHIIPWSQADLDEVYNGIALCKLHHWAFDERLLQIVYRSGTYYVEMPEQVVSNLPSDGFSLDQLMQVVGPIPIERLPRYQENWPKPELLERLLRDTF
jgi:hypothetical protein